MSLNKRSYFQGGGGVNEPTPNKIKYKIESAPVNQPRFEEPFYRNYDLYDVPGKHGPGTGVYHMNKHKSVKDFLDKKRKNIRKNYDSLNRKKRLNNLKARKDLLSKIIKNAISFPIDDQITSTQIEEPGDIYEKTVRMDGLTDYLPLPDFDGKSPDKLNFGRDYEPNSINYDLLDIINELYNPKETDLFGLPNGFEPEEDLDADKTIFTMNPSYSITDSGNTAYSNMWF